MFFFWFAKRVEFRMGRVVGTVQLCWGATKGPTGSLKERVVDGFGVKA